MIIANSYINEEIINQQYDGLNANNQLYRITRYGFVYKGFSDTIPEMNITTVNYHWGQMSVLILKLRDS